MFAPRYTKDKGGVANDEFVVFNSTIFIPKKDNGRAILKIFRHSFGNMTKKTIEHKRKSPIKYIFNIFILLLKSTL